MKIKKELAKKFKPLKKPIQKKTEKKPEEKPEKKIVNLTQKGDLLPVFEDSFDNIPAALNPEDLVLSSGQTLQTIHQPTSSGNLERTASSATTINSEEDKQEDLVKYASFEGLYSERKDDNRNQDPNRTFEVSSRNLNLETFEARMPTTNTFDPRTRMGMVRPSELMDLDQEEKYDIKDIRDKKDEKMPWEQEQDPNIKKYNSRR